MENGESTEITEGKIRAILHEMGMEIPGEEVMAITQAIQKLTALAAKIPGATLGTLEELVQGELQKKEREKQQLDDLKALFKIAKDLYRTLVPDKPFYSIDFDNPKKSQSELVALASGLGVQLGGSHLTKLTIREIMSGLMRPLELLRDNLQAIYDRFSPGPQGIVGTSCVVVHGDRLVETEITGLEKRGRLKVRVSKGSYNPLHVYKTMEDARRNHPYLQN